MSFEAGTKPRSTSALADGVARHQSITAFHRVAFGTRVAVVSIDGRAVSIYESANAADRRAIARATSVHGVEVVDEDLAFTAHEAVVLIGPRRFVATCAPCIID